MTPWSAAPTVLDPPEDWEELEAVLSGGEPVVIQALPGGPVLLVQGGAGSGPPLVLFDERYRLRAQDRRRLHRLGLRPEDADGAWWTWSPAPPLPPPLPSRAGVLTGLVEALQEQAAAVRGMALAVLRDALQLTPQQLRATVTEPELEEDDWDDWDDDAWDGGPGFGDAADCLTCGDCGCLDCA